MRPPRAELRVRVGGSALRATAVHRGVVTWAGEAAYADEGELSDAIARLAGEAPRSCRVLTVELERPPAQARTLLDLPPVKTSYLKALVAQQATRFFRKNGRPLATDAMWVGKGVPRVARAVAVEEPLAEVIASGARAAGLWLEAITPAEEPGSLSLLPTSERLMRERVARKLTRRLALTTFVVWLMTGALFLGRLAFERRAVDHELAALRTPLTAVLDARRELWDAATTLDAIATAERQRTSALTALSAITSALPDSSVLTSLAWSADGSGVLIGGARRATDVLARLDGLSALGGVRLSGPAVRDVIAGKEWERFTILFGREGS